MSAEKYDYKLDDFFYGETCKAELDSGLILKMERNALYDFIELIFDENNDSLVDASAIKQDINREF